MESKALLAKLANKTGGFKHYSKKILCTSREAAAKTTCRMSCEEAQLHKERLQALAEKRKRQTEIDDKRSQLDDLVLQLQHLKSKATRERWLLQGMAPEQEEPRRKQLELDEEHGKVLEDKIQRLESEISALENEESQISAKEQVLRERLKETERSIEDLQKSLMAHDGEATGCTAASLSDGAELNPGPLALATPCQTCPPAPGEKAAPRPAMFAMEINVERDAQTGEQRILSASRVSPTEAGSRGVKVYDDGRKVVYEVTSSGGVSTTSLENGWSSSQVDQLIQRAARPGGRGDHRGGHVLVTPAAPQASLLPAPADDLSPPSCAPPSIPSSPPAQVTLQRETRLGMVPPSSGPIVTQPGPSVGPGPEIGSVPQIDAEHPVTMVFLGYQDLEDTSESRRLLGFDGAVKAEVVLIDEDDEKSLREKTVTDLSIIDGTAADLVSGRPVTSEAVSTELSSDGREPDSAVSPPPNPDANKAPPPGLTPATDYGVLGTTTNGHQAVMPGRNPHTTMNSWQAPEDVSGTLPKERALKSVTFQESVSIITDGPLIMEVESQQVQHGCLSRSGMQGHSALELKVETSDGEVEQEIRYLDQVLDAASDTPTNGNSSPSAYTKPISIDGKYSSVCVSNSSPDNHQPIIVEGQRQTTFVHQDESTVKTNGHMPREESSQSSAKFELRAFQEDRRPAKLFTPGEDRHVRVTMKRNPEEAQELERERQELIRDQAVKKNPGIAQRWWNPPQEVPLEEQLDPEQLESLRKYQERKTQKQYTYSQPQVTGPPTLVTSDPELIRKEDIVEKKIDFSSARKQFLQADVTKNSVAPHIYSARPFSKSVLRGNLGSSNTVPETGECHVTWSDEGVGGEFTSVRAVMTNLSDDEEGKSQFHLGYLPEESDSGLEELSVRSQDTTVFSLDSVSDSGASLPPTPLPLTPVSPSTPQPTTPVNGRTTGSAAEDELEYQAEVLVQNVIQNALSANRDDWQSSLPNLDSSQMSSPVSPSSASTSSPVPVSSSPLSFGEADHLQSAVSSSSARSNPSPQPDRLPEVQVGFEGKPTETQNDLQQKQLSSPTPPSQPSQTPHAISPPQRPKEGGPRIKIQSSYTRALASSASVAAPASGPVSTANVPRPSTVCRPPSPPSPEKSEFSYFSKYSEAAELRSTAAATKGPEVEVTSGPFRLRSKKQRTLSMIEEEIRAAQQREEELKKQREGQPAVIPRVSSTSSSSQVPARTGIRKTTISPADKLKTNSLPTRLTMTTRTAPGTIEKVRPAPPVSPSPSEGALSDAGSEDSAGSRAKNFMQTLMEDYETHKVKRREKMEDNSYARLLLANEVTTEVLEATRITRRKSDMALKWEAGIYANEDGEEEEEEEEE
ncbi:PALM2-AKAP2 fusion protein isoform X2 [Syngnathoides biaculeatus]|uniref:PALM2-AKAP2 fusion protein isoform X2 n=1 Tax=Syngnathoides biaculeatus TaxID=300417 RepID=UPI002ADE7F5F|nr:PALM2-AKAP2 fusion protein isoform X2 [Syngnathoides biaculeatus]